MIEELDDVEEYSEDELECIRGFDAGESFCREHQGSLFVCRVKNEFQRAFYSMERAAVTGTWDFMLEPGSCVILMGHSADEGVDLPLWSYEVLYNDMLGTVCRGMYPDDFMKCFTLESSYVSQQHEICVKEE